MIKKEYIIISIILVLVAIPVLGFGIAIPCVFHELTGLYCAGCGSTRACIALSRGQFYQAIRYNSVVFVDLAAIFSAVVLSKITKNNKKVEIAINVVLVILTIITVLYGILRNIPMFSYLAPTQII